MVHLPKLSCIINVRNGEKFIAETIKSVLLQTVPVYIIIVDNFSSDKTKEIVESFLPNPLIQIVSPPDPCLLGEARNFSISLVKTEYVGWLDADDLWESEYAERIIKAFEENPKAVYCYAGCTTINEQGIELNSNKQYWMVQNKYKNYNPTEVDISLFDFLKYTLKSAWCSYSFKMDIVKKINGFNTSLNYAEDYDFISKIKDYGNGLFIALNLSKYRLHENQLTKNTSYKNKNAEKILVVNRYYKNKKINLFSYLRILVFYQNTIYAEKIREKPSFKNVFLFLFYKCIDPTNLLISIKGRLFS